MKAILAKGTGILLGLVLGAALLHALLPRARAREDRATLSAARPYCQVLLVGPSYANQVVPREFDAEARRIGLNKRFCKLGRAGMVGYELVNELELALSERWPKLELVLVDITLGRGPSFPEGNWFKPRTVEWHTLDGMKWLLDYYEDFPKQSPDLREWLSHGQHFLAHYASLGRAPELFGWREPIKVTSALAPKPPPQKAKGKERGKRKAVAATGGDSVAKKSKRAKTEKRASTKGGGKSRKRSGSRAKKVASDVTAPASSSSPARSDVVALLTGTSSGRASFSKKDKKRFAETAELVEWNHEHARKPYVGESEWVHGLRRQVARHGYEAFFVIAPVWYHPRIPADALGGKTPLTLLRYNDPERFPDLYLPESRGNTHHLSKAGKPVYSRIMARELFARWKPR